MILIKSPWVYTATSQYLSWYDMRCCQEIKLQQTKLSFRHFEIVVHVVLHAVTVLLQKYQVFGKWPCYIQVLILWHLTHHQLSRVSWLLAFCILTTFKVISGWGLIGDSAHSWWLYSAAPLGNHAASSTITIYPTQSCYAETVLTSPCPICIIPNNRLGSDKYQFDKSLVWLDWEPHFWSPTQEAHILPMWPSCPLIQ